MLGVGLAWASILAMPYAILTGSLPQHKLGIYMGIFNFFIVIPQILADREGIDKLAHLVRAYFKLDGHHVQFNVEDADTLREAQADPDSHRDLIVRVAGYSDYFCDLGPSLQDEIIARTAHQAF